MRTDEMLAVENMQAEIERLTKERDAWRATADYIEKLKDAEIEKLLRIIAASDKLPTDEQLARYHGDVDGDRELN